MSTVIENLGGQRNGGSRIAPAGSVPSSFLGGGGLHELGVEFLDTRRRSHTKPLEVARLREPEKSGRDGPARRVSVDIRAKMAVLGLG